MAFPSPTKKAVLREEGRARALAWAKARQLNSPRPQANRKIKHDTPTVDRVSGSLPAFRGQSDAPSFDHGSTDSRLRKQLCFDDVLEETTESFGSLSCARLATLDEDARNSPETNRSAVGNARNPASRNCTQISFPRKNLPERDPSSDGFLCQDGWDAAWFLFDVLRSLILGTLFALVSAAVVIHCITLWRTKATVELSSAMLYSGAIAAVATFVICVRKYSHVASQLRRSLVYRARDYCLFVLAEKGNALDRRGRQKKQATRNHLWERELLEMTARHLYPTSLKDRLYFKRRVWPDVVNEIVSDERYGMEERIVVGKAERVFLWIEK